ncbi:hemerythrin domain-containing protein [Novispirillum itersonii]|uniref:Hemerythrin-like domain-containing protein n=1 Tax=Novispirillum itersonii TaxID=189 RepID=A0A7W9ZD70_NOVIT|nr:hemerythrin domain-containing protein [Novispirillum itersonii]MBB6209336.1 hemerythrin-like domain-containing protein [Novispirillum itersonii]
MTSDFFGQTRTGALLHGEHQSTLAALVELETFTGSRTPPELDASRRAFLLRLYHLIEADVTDHFTFEEDNLFPRIAAAGAGFMVDMLSAEHEDIRALAQDIRAMIGAFLDETPITPDRWTVFRTTARDLIDMETFHIQKEEMGLLAALPQVLDDQEDAGIAARHAKHAGG